MSLTLTIAGVTITGTSHKVERESFSFVNAIGQRDTLSFSVCSSNKSYVPATGAQVVLTDSVLSTLFGGNIRQLSSALRGESLVSTVGCASWEQLFDRRTTGQQHYRDMAAGDVFSDLVTNTMGGEGITASVAVSGPNITLDLDFASVREAFDKIVELASNATDTYFWDCLPDKTVRFYRQDTHAAPFNCTATNHNILRPITASWSLDDYANRVYVRMGLYVRENLTKSFVGDGATKSWTLDFPLAAEPTITVGGVLKTVGIMDSDTGKDWYYRINSPEIIQDAGAAAVGVGVAIDVDPYKGYEAIVLPALQDDDEVDARNAAEGGTGYYEAVISLDTPGGATDATAAAQAYLDRHAKIPVSVEYMTAVGGAKAGQYQTVNLPIFGINATFFIQSATLEFQGQWLWRIKAVAGALIPDYIARLRKLSGDSGGVAGAMTGQGTGTGPEGPPGTAATPAPEIPSATAAAIYSLLGNDSVFGFGGTITLPTGHADYTHLAKIDVEIQQNGTTGWIPLVSIPRANFGASTVTYSGGQFAQPTFGTSWQVRFLAINEVGSPSPASLVIGSIGVTGSAVSGFASAADAGARTVLPEHRDVRLVSTAIQFVPTLAGNIVPQNVTFWITSSRDTTKYTYIGWTLISTVGQTVTVSRLVPGATATWHVYAKAGAIGGDASVDVTGADLLALGATPSAGFSVSGLGLPSAGAVTTATVGAAQTITDPDGHQYVRIPPVSWTDPTDVDAAFVRITVQCVDASGNPAPADQGGTETATSGPQDAMGDVLVPGAVRTNAKLEFDFNPSGSVYTYIQYRMYLLNRNATDTDDWADATKSVLQTSAWSGAAFRRVNFGSLPAGALNLTRASDGSLGQGIYRDPVTGVVKAGQTNTSNLVINPSFEDQLRAWTIHVPSTVVIQGPGAPYSGQYNVVLTANGSGNAGLHEAGRHECKTGEKYFISCVVLSDPTVTGTIYLEVVWRDGAGTQISAPVVASQTNTAGVWVKIGAVMTAPTNASTFEVWVDVGGETPTKNWALDSVSAIWQPPAGAGLQPDGFGGLAAKLGGAYVGVDGSGNLQVTGASLDSTRLAAGSLGDLSKYSSSVRAIGIVFGLPSLPNTSYPLGAIIFNTADSKLYRVIAGPSWSKGTDPQDLIAGTIAAGVVYTGVVVANQVAAGTIAAAVTMTAPTLVVSGSGYTINLDSTNGFKVSGNNTTTTITNTSDAVSGQPAGVKVLDTSTNWFTTVCPRGFFMSDGSGAVAQMSQAGTGGHVRVSNPTSGSIFTVNVSTGSPTCRLDGSSPAFNINGTSGFTGTLAAAISAGRSVVGGIIV